jgi:hypothetical protein
VKSNTVQDVFRLTEIPIYTKFAELPNISAVSPTLTRKSRRKYAEKPGKSGLFRQIVAEKETVKTGHFEKSL